VEGVGSGVEEEGGGTKEALELPLAAFPLILPPLTLPPLTLPPLTLPPLTLPPLFNAPNGSIATGATGFGAAIVVDPPAALAGAAGPGPAGASVANDPNGSKNISLWAAPP